MEELQKMFEWFKQELKDYNGLSSIEFLLKYEYWFKDTIIKDYERYISDNSDEDPDNILDYEEWKEEFEEEMNYELNDRVREYFISYDLEEYKSEYNYIWEILLSWWWPWSNLIVESKWEKVTWKWYWASDKFEWDLSQYYDIIVDIYNLDIN